MFFALSNHTLYFFEDFFSAIAEQAMSLLPGDFITLKNCPMKRLSTTKALIAFLAICISGSASAQSDNPKYEFGVNFGFLVYQGDLTPERMGSFRTQKFSIGLHASRILGPAFSLRAHLEVGSLKGDDAVYKYPEYRQQRNFNFSTPVTELSAQLIWNVTGSNYADKGFSPYLFAGAGLAYFNIKKDWSRINTSYFDHESSEIWSGLAIDSVHQLPPILPVVPVGGGIKYFFTPRWGINAETSYRFVFTDYLDGFSQAVNPKRDDHYLNYSIGLIYRTGKKNRLACPAMKY
jgi:Domain of unknown function (DUF6089)